MSAADPLPSPTLLGGQCELLELLPDGLLVVAPDGRVVWANGKAGGLFGYAPDALIGMPLEQLVPERFRAAHEQHVRRYVLDPRARPMGTALDLFGLRKDGSEFPLDVSLSPVATEDGLRVFATLRDATARKAGEVALGAALAEYHDLYENAPDMLASVDGRSGRILRCNQTFASALGLMKEEIVGRTVFDLHHPDHRDPAHQIFRAFAATGEVRDAEIVLRRKDGSKLEASLSVSAVRDEHGNVVSSRSIVRDITGRKRAERELRRSEERFRTVFDYAPLGIALVDRGGHPFHSNLAMREMLGRRPEEEFTNVRCRDLTHPEDADESDRLFQELLEGKRERYRLEKRYARPDGGVVWGDTAVAAVRDDEGQLQYAIPMVADITQRKQAEEAARRSEAQLRQAQKMEAVGQLTSGIAHDFNNLLTAIMSNIELVGQSLPPAFADLRQQLEEARQAGTRGAELIKKLLGFSRRATLALVTIDLGALIHDLSKLLRRIVPEHIEMEVRPEVPAVIRADPGAVEQIVLNLVSNARDAMPGGGHLRIEVKGTRLDEGYHASHPWVAAGDYVALTVSDTGIGMDAATRDRIFDPFFTTKAPGEGTGLGMAMVYGLVKEHRGFVHVYSEPAQGTTVKIWFPAAHETPMDHGTPAPAGAPLRRGTETILVVEDEPSIRRAAKRALESQGYTVRLAADGEEALEMIRSEERSIDLVLLDLVMPRLGGRQVYEALRREGRRMNIVFTSGYAAREVQDAAALPSDTPFLHKPWTLTDLFRLVRDTLDR